MRLDVLRDRRDRHDMPDSRSQYLHTFPVQLAHWHNGSSCGVPHDKSDNLHQVHRVFWKDLVSPLCDAPQLVDGKDVRKSMKMLENIETKFL